MAQGVDLGRHAEDVRRIVLRIVGAKARAEGVDPEELLAVVYGRILRANVGRSPYDPTRGSLSRYVVLQARSALANMLDSRRRRWWEQVGAVGLDGVERDAAAVERAATEPIHEALELPDDQPPPWSPPRPSRPATRRRLIRRRRDRPVGNVGQEEPIMMRLLAALIVAGTALTDSTAETVLGSHQLAPHHLQPGKIIKGRALVRTTGANSTDTLTLRLRVGGTTLTGTAVVTSTAVDQTVGDISVMDFELVARGAGKAVTIVSTALANDPDAPGQNLKAYGAIVADVDTTAALLIEVTGQWSVAHEDNSCQLESLTLFEAV